MANEFSSITRLCTNKYQYLAADTDDDLNNKFTVGETVTGSVSGAKGVVKEIHVNLGYVTIELTSGTFTITGETINGATSGSAAACNFIKSEAYAPHHHRDTSGVRVRRSNVTVPYTLLDYETAVIDQNRQIKAVKPEHINTVAQAFIAVQWHKMNIDNFKVTAAATDITRLVQGMTFFESINGLLKGNIQILDGKTFLIELLELKIN